MEGKCRQRKGRKGGMEKRRRKEIKRREKEGEINIVAMSSRNGEKEGRKGRKGRKGRREGGEDGGGGLEE